MQQLKTARLALTSRIWKLWFMLEYNVITSLSRFLGSSFHVLINASRIHHDNAFDKLVFLLGDIIFFVFAWIFFVVPPSNEH